MTEKRFEINNIASQNNFSFWDNENELIMNASDTLDLLNEQNETIQQLKAEIKQLNHDLDLYEENNTNEVLNKLRIELTSRMNDCIEEFKE